MLSGAQIRAARAFLKWSAKDLARKSGVSWATIQRMENVDGPPDGLIKNIRKIEKAFTSEGIEFIFEEGKGVGVKTSPLNVL